MMMLWMMKTMMMTTLPRTLCGHLPNKAAVEVRQKEQRGIISQLEYFQPSPTGPTVQDDTRAPARQKIIVGYQRCKDHLRSVGGRTKANNPHFSCNNGRSSNVQSSRKGGERTPGCCSREEGDHRREGVVGFISTPSNDKSLKMFQRLIRIKSHPIRRESGTAVLISILWQLRKLFYKAADVVPANIT